MFVLWFYHCGSCGAVSTKYHETCLVCGSKNNLEHRQAAIALKGSENFPYPISVGMQSDTKQPRRA